MHKPETEVAREQLLTRPLSQSNVQAIRKGGFTDGPYRWDKWEDDYNQIYSWHKDNGTSRTIAHGLFDWLSQLISLEKRGILLWGPVGRGKSHLARLIGIYAVQRYDLGRVLYVNWPQFLARARANHGSADLVPLMDAQFLVLDDLAGERLTLWASEQLYCVIEARFSQLGTIITGNLTIDQWESEILNWRNGARRGESLAEIQRQAMRIADRLHGLCVTEMMVDAPQSYRRL